MHLTDYLPHGPAMSTPPSERVRDVLTARHRKANTLFSRTGFALIICIFVSLTSALPTFGHNIPQVLVSEGGKCETDGGNVCDTHTLNEYWDEFVRTHLNEEYWYANSHWHMHIKEDDTADGIGGWKKCVAAAYRDGDYHLVEGNCPDGTSTDVITPPSETNVDPVFNGPTTASVPENTTSVLTVLAEDDDRQDHVTYSIYRGPDEADALKFSIGPSTGELRFKTAPDYEDRQDVQSTTPQNAAGDNEYVVKVIATSGSAARERTAEKTIIVTVTDVPPPNKPDPPLVSTGSQMSLHVSWSEPNDNGSPINDYDYRYGTALNGPWREITNTTIIGLSTTIEGLTQENTVYYVQIQANSPEGASGWSDSGRGSTGSTDTNAAPKFTMPETNPARESVPENSTLELTIAAVDDDEDDSVTNYSIEGGADRGQFTISVSSTEPKTANLTFTAQDHEDPQDLENATPYNEEGNNQYVVIVRATSGTGDRIRTTDQTIIVTVTNVSEDGRSGQPSGHHGHHARGNGRRLAIGNTPQPAARGCDRVIYENALCGVGGRRGGDVHSAAERSGQPRRGGGVRNFERHGEGGAGLRGDDRDPDLPGGDDEAGDPRAHH